MKKKIALILASVMTLSMLPMNLFAASNNHFSKTPTTVPENTLLYEEAFPGIATTGEVDATVEMRTSGASLYDVDRHGADLGDVEYATEGTHLIVSPTDAVRAGDTFRVRLTNARWFFRASTEAVKAVETQGTAGLVTDAIDAAATLDKASARKLTTATVATEAISTEAYVADDNADAKKTDNVAYALGMNYDINRGVWIPSGEEETDGTYYRFFVGPDANIYNEVAQIPYKLTVSPLDDSVATIEILGLVNQVYAPPAANTGTNNIVIPLVTLVTGSEDVKVKVESSLTGVSSGTYIYGLTGGGKTTTTVKATPTSREEFDIEKIVITENRLNSLDENGSIKLTLPDGFTWGNLDEAEVFTDSGVEWKNSTNNKGVRFDYNSDHEALHGYSEPENVMHWLYYDELGNTNGKNETLSEQIPASADYALGYDFFEDTKHKSSNSSVNHGSTNADGHYEIDEQTIILSVNNFKSSARIPGAVYIEGLSIEANEQDAKFGEFSFTIEDVKDDEWGVTEETVKAGTRTEYGMALTTTTTVPTLIAGRYEELNSANFDKYQKTARVKLAENVTNSWWAGRTSTLTLPEGVKFSQVDVTGASELEQGDALKDAGYLYADGKKHGAITVEDNKITFTNLKVNADKKGSVTMDLWLSIKADYAGEDIKLTAGGTAFKDDIPPVVIAKVMKPVEVTAEVTDIKIGLQYQTTGNIVIKETAAGNLERGKNVKVSVTDMVSSDVSFSPKTVIAVTEGDIKYKNFSTSGTGSWDTSLVSGSSALSFDIDKASTKASTFTISNVAVKVDRTVPLSNDRPYDVVVWGSAVAQNFNTTADAKKDQFSTAGIKTNYIRVVTAADGQEGLLTKEVRVTKGERSVSVNGVVVTMPAAAYISPASNSMMVPIRFVAKGLGISEDKISYDDLTKTVTINHDSKIVQFTTGSSVMKINNAPINMFSKDATPLPVKAENTGDYVYIPFRALGEAFGIPVSYVNETSTAVYNAGANVVSANGAAVQ